MCVTDAVTTFRITLSPWEIAYTPRHYPYTQYLRFRSRIVLGSIQISMRWGLLCAFAAMAGAVMAGRPVFADTLLSVSAAAGTQSCSQSSAVAAFCTVSSTVSLPGGGFSSPVYAGGSLSFGPTNFGAGSPGPQTVGPLDYSLEGNWAMGQGIGLSGQAAVTLSASILLPSDSGNWTFYGSTFDATDDQGGGVGAIQIVTSDGSGWIQAGPDSSFTVAHTPGTPFSVSLNLSDLVEAADSSNQFDFDLRMVDPVSTPEPATWMLVLCALPGIFLLTKLRTNG
jgi:hypothetical protein